jgi:L-amino acid N-acyltransferase YncA
MYVRLALESDFSEIVELARLNVTETRSDLAFDADRALATCHAYLESAEPTIFVCEANGQIIGLTLSSISDYRAAAGLFTTQEVLFVRPDKRGTRAAVLLMKNLIAWSQALGAKEIIGGNDNDFNSDRTAAFLGHFGFHRVGHAMKKVL